MTWGWCAILRVLCDCCSRSFGLVDQRCDKALAGCIWCRLAIRMRQSVIEAAVDNLGRRFGRWDAIVGLNWLGRFQSGALYPLDYAVDPLVTVLLRRSVLLVFLKIGTTSHIVAQAWTASASGRGGIGHLRIYSEKRYSTYRAWYKARRGEAGRSKGMEG